MSNDLEDPTNAEQKILELCSLNPDGISNSVLQESVSKITSEQLLASVNRLLSLGKIDLLKGSQGSILYRLKDSKDLSMANSTADLDEKLVFTVIKEAGNKGIWTRDIGNKTNVKSTALTKVLKSLESKKLIKSVVSVTASKKRYYMLYELEPDRQLTGGAWYSGKEFESEFIEILNEQCYHFLLGKREISALTTTGNSSSSSTLNDPYLARRASFANSKEIRDYIKNLGISKVDLEVQDIECILDTLVYDGKVEKSVIISNATTTTKEQSINLYRAINPILKYEHGSSLMRAPCGICPLINDCHDDGRITPFKCNYLKEWLDF